MLNFFVYNAILKFPNNDPIMLRNGPIMPIMLRNGPIMLMVLAIILIKSSIIST